VGAVQGEQDGFLSTRRFDRPRRGRFGECGQGSGGLIGQARPGHSIPGIAVTVAALIVMPLLAIAKRRTGQAMNNPAVIADSTETAFCAFTSAAALLGIGLNAWLRWWWADPAAALVIAERLTTHRQCQVP
jgi:divalent metal cation (Fe/Co/Zn/Cd) transporter